MTVNVWSPTVEVSRFAPFAHGADAGVHPRLAVDALVLRRRRPCRAGSAPRQPARVIVTVGFTASTLNAISFVASTLPATSIEWYWTKWFPVVKPEIGPV